METTKVEFIIEEEFVLSEYFEKMETIIQNILLRPENDVLTYDILDTEKSKKNKLLSLKEKQRQMKVGEIWQEIIGNYNEFINLKIGHETGLDILSNTRKLAIELKNRTNTDNASSKSLILINYLNLKKKIQNTRVFMLILMLTQKIKHYMVLIKKLHTMALK